MNIQEIMNKLPNSMNSVGDKRGDSHNKLGKEATGKGSFSSWLEVAQDILQGRFSQKSLSHKKMHGIKEMNDNQDSPKAEASADPLGQNFNQGLELQKIFHRPENTALQASMMDGMGSQERAIAEKGAAFKVEQAKKEAKSQNLEKLEKAEAKASIKAAEKQTAEDEGQATKFEILAKEKEDSSFNRLSSSSINEKQSLAKTNKVGAQTAKRKAALSFEFAHNINNNPKGKTLQIGDKLAINQKHPSSFRPSITDVTILSQKNQPHLHSLRLQLHPHGLGTVDVKMHLSGHSMRVSIMASNSDTANLLTQDRYALRHILESSSLSHAHKLNIVILDKNGQVISELGSSHFDMEDSRQDNAQGQNNFLNEGEGFLGHQGRGKEQRNSAFEGLPSLDTDEPIVKERSQNHSDNLVI